VQSLISGIFYQNLSETGAFSDEISSCIQKTVSKLRYYQAYRKTLVFDLGCEGDLKAFLSNETLAQMVIALREEGRLCIIHEEEQIQEPRIICSLGLVKNSA